MKKIAQKKPKKMKKAEPEADYWTLRARKEGWMDPRSLPANLPSEWEGLQDVDECW